MIIGRGDISKAIDDREGFIFFAAGCSNRFKLTDDAMQKEEWAIQGIRTEKMFVYFSTLSIYRQQHNAYITHKIRMEVLVKQFTNHCIMRIGNITWGDNPNTLINHLKKDQSRVEETYRHLISINDLQYWCHQIPRFGKHQMNVTGRLVYVPDLVNEINERKIHTD